MQYTVDCIHWIWKNCPVGSLGQCLGKESVPTIVLEAIASQDLWIWHAYFGYPGALNDLSVLERSFVFRELREGRSPDIKYTVNGNQYTLGCYLADAIYPPYANLVKTISNPRTDATKVLFTYRFTRHFTNTRYKQSFAEAQEAARKDIERAFGVLEARFTILKVLSDSGTLMTLHQF